MTGTAPARAHLCALGGGACGGKLKRACPTRYSGTRVKVVRSTYLPYPTPYFSTSSDRHHTLPNSAYIQFPPFYTFCELPIHSRHRLTVKVLILPYFLEATPDAPFTPKTMFSLNFHLETPYTTPPRLMLKGPPLKHHPRRTFPEPHPLKHE